MKRVNFNNFEQLTFDDLNNMGIFELSTNTLGILKEHISGDNAVISSGLTITYVSNNTLRIEIGRGISATGDFLINDNVAFELLGTNAQHDIVGGDGVPADVTDGNIFLIEIQFTEIDGASELRNFIDPNGNTFSQTVTKEKIIAIKSRIKEGSAVIAPSVDSGWTKIAEVKKNADSDYTIYSVDKLFNALLSDYDNTGWTNEKKITHLMKTFVDHRSAIPIDHPVKAIQEQHLSQDVQDKLNLSQQGTVVGNEYTDQIVKNLLNKGVGEARDNRSLEYFFGTGLDTDYYETKQLIDEYKDNLDNDDVKALNVDAYDITNVSQQTLTNLQCDISNNTLFDIYLDSIKVMTAINTDYDWTLEIVTIAAGLISFRPQTTWEAFKSGVDSTNPSNLKIVGANDGIDGLEKSSVLVDVTLLFNKAAFDEHFQGTSLNIVVTKDGQVYKWDGTGVPSAALTADNFVYGYEMLLQPSEDGGASAKMGTVAGENDAGWDYRKIAVNQHRMFTPENFKLLVGKYSNDCVTAVGYKYYDQFGSKLYQMKTQVVMRKGFLLEGFHRFVSIIRFDETEVDWVDWTRFVVEREVLRDLTFTAAINAVVTLTAHGLTNDDYIQVLSSTPADILIGMYKITYVSVDSFSINYNTSGGSGGVCKIVLVDKKSITVGSHLSLFSESTTTVPVQVAGARDGRFNIFDIVAGTAYGMDGDNENKNLEVHEDAVFTQIDVSTVSRENLSIVAERSVDNASDIDQNEEEIFRLKSRLSAAEIKALDLQLQTYYLSQRKSSSPDFLMEPFFNKDQTTDLTGFTNEVDVMDETDFNNNWKERDGIPDFKNAFIRNKRQPYMLEVVDKYNLEGIGQVNKCAISSYDSTNECYWMISHSGSNNLGEITKLSKTMNENKVQVLARYYLPANGASTYWTGIDSDGSDIYFTLHGLNATSTVYKCPINSNGTIGKSGNEVKNGEVINLALSVDLQTSSVNGYYNDVIIWDSNNIMVLNIDANNSAKLISINKSLGSGTVNNIIEFEKYINVNTNTHANSLVRNGNDLWIKVNNNAEDYRFIYKFNISNDIVSDTPDDRVIKASGRFKTERNVDQANNALEGITVSHDGDILSVTSTSDAKLISRHAVKNVLWAENQVPTEIQLTDGGTDDNRATCFDGSYVWYSANNGNNDAVRIYRRDIATGIETYMTLTNGGWDFVMGMCVADVSGIDYFYLIGYDGVNYISRAITRTDFESALNGNLLLASVGNAFIGYETDKSQYDICSDGSYLYIINTADNGIDRWDLASIPTNKVDNHITLPAAASYWYGIAWKNNKFYIVDFNSSGMSKIYIIKDSSPYYRKHIHQSPIDDIGKGHQIDFHNNDLYIMHNLNMKLHSIKTLEDPDVMQLQVFLDSSNVLLSSNVSCATPIVERHFKPEDFADIRDVPDQKYMAVGYGDEGISLLHLDEFLSDRSSTGKDRRDVEKIRVQHYKISQTDNSTNCNIFEKYFPDTIYIEKDVISIGCPGTGGTWYHTFVQIYLKEGIALCHASSVNRRYVGSLSERNDGKGIYGITNTELSIPSTYIRKIHARTFTKEDSSDYQEENPKTFVLIGTDSGCDLLIIDWDSNGNRTPVKVWNNIFAANVSMGQYAIWIAKSGKVFGGDYNANGTIVFINDLIWNINKEGSDVSFTQIGSYILGGFVMDIAPNSRCWKTPSGEWRHQLICAVLEVSGGGDVGLSIVDVENETKDNIWSHNSGVTAGYVSVDNYEDDIFPLYRDSSVIKGILIYEKLRFDDNRSAWFFDNWTQKESMYPNNRPRFSILSTGTIGSIRYSINESILIQAMNVGLNMQLFPVINQCQHESIDFTMSELKRYYNYLQTTILPTGEKVTKIETNDGNIVYTNGTTKTWSGSGTAMRSIDRDGGAQEGYLTWSSITGVTKIGFVFLKDDSSGGVWVGIKNTTNPATGDTINGSPIITDLKNISDLNLRVGMVVEETNIPKGTKILSIDSATQITLDANAVGTAGDVALIFYYDIDLWYDEDATADNGDEDYYTCWITIPNTLNTFQVIAKHSGLNNSGTGDHLQFVNAFTVKALMSGVVEATLIMKHSAHTGEEKPYVMVPTTVTEVTQNQQFTATAGQTEFTLSGTDRANDLEYITINGGESIYPGDPSYNWGSNSPNYDDEIIDSNGFLTVKTASGQSAGDVIRLYFNPKADTFNVKTKLKQPNDGSTFIHHGQSVKVLDYAVELIG